uniref:FSD1-like protein isoform X1 n=3 Tax=Myxine glutinosa TaxID=7769 RepID=UPI00358E6E5F
MKTKIRLEQTSKTNDLDNQITSCVKALESSEELLDFAQQTMRTSDEKTFTEAAKQIKDRVTMAPAFRLSLLPKVSDNMNHLMVDFAPERELLRSLSFLPVPHPPALCVENCTVSDNRVCVRWDLVQDSSKADHFTLAYRPVDHPGLALSCDPSEWVSIDNIHANEYTITGLVFEYNFMSVRVRACNKAVAGEYSEAVIFETPAFNFLLDCSTSHPNLRVDGKLVEWDPMTGKGHEVKGKGKENKGRPGSATGSPAGSPISNPPGIRPSDRSLGASPKQRPGTPVRFGSTRSGRDRFTGESYSVLGDTQVECGQHYWEIHVVQDSKSYAVGVAYRGFGRFDQLGRTVTSWALQGTTWLQSNLAAKHNNKSKTLDCEIPKHLGIYCDYDNGVLSFYNAESQQLLYSFRARFTNPLLPGFMVWCGTLTVVTGLQVPSYISTLGRPDNDSSSTSSLTQ